MLVLTRCIEAGLWIVHPDGTRIRVRVLRVGTNRRGQTEVVLGLEAPRSVTILREELADARRLLDFQPPVAGDKPPASGPTR
jgi:sRNA-binding carbon storage regulator CsrA